MTSFAWQKCCDGMTNPPRHPEYPTDVSASHEPWQTARTRWYTIVWERPASRCAVGLSLTSSHCILTCASASTRRTLHRQKESLFAFNPKEPRPTSHCTPAHARVVSIFLISNSPRFQIESHYLRAVLGAALVQTWDDSKVRCMLTCACPAERFCEKAGVTAGIWSGTSLTSRQQAWFPERYVHETVADIKYTLYGTLTSCPLAHWYALTTQVARDFCDPVFFCSGSPLGGNWTLMRWESSLPAF